MSTLSLFSCKTPLRVRRRLMLVAIYGSISLGMGIAFAGAANRAGAGVGGGTTSAANQAAAEEEFQKAKALYDSGKYAEANVENEKALKLDPKHSQAQLLQKVLAGKIAGGTGGGSGGAGQASTPGKLGVLSAQQISMIRLAELSSADNNIRGTIDPKVLEDFWQDVILKDPTVSQSPQLKQLHDSFVSRTNFANQVRRIRESGDPKYLSQIQLQSDPASINAFKTNIHNNYMLQTCATADCHNSERPGNTAFRLVTTPTGPNGPTAEQQLYTNFYIMANYANKDGKMIDRDAPEKSLFLQYDLPKNVASTPHPKVDVPRKLTGLNDPRFRNMAGWVQTLVFPKPNYGITFEIPGMTLTTQPASQPATVTK